MEETDEPTLTLTDEVTLTPTDEVALNPDEPTLTPTDLLERLGLLEFYPQRLTVQMGLEKTFSLPDLQTEEGSISTQQLPWYFLKVSYISS